MLLLLLAAAASSGCVRFGYGVGHVEEPVPAAALAALRPGADDLGACLQHLGAPHFVWEYRGNGVALGWVYSDSSDWDFDVSYSFGRMPSASFSLDWDDSDLPGVVLWFDADLRLLEWRRGRMRELTSGLRRRPSADGDGG